MFPFLEKFKHCLMNMNPSLILLIVNISNYKVKISEIMKENNNLKGKIKTLEESSKKECETLKKSLVEALEKYKLIEKKTDGTK